MALPLSQPGATPTPGIRSNEGRDRPQVSLSLPSDLRTPDSPRRRLAMRYNDLFVLQSKTSREKPYYYPAPD